MIIYDLYNILAFFITKLRTDVKEMFNIKIKKLREKIINFIDVKFLVQGQRKCIVHKMYWQNRTTRQRLEQVSQVLSCNRHYRYSRKKKANISKRKDYYVRIGGRTLLMDECNVKYSATLPPTLETHNTLRQI